MDDPDLVLRVKFYQTDSSREPVRNWLRNLDKGDRKIIGEDLKTVQFGWPLGMPLVRKLSPDLWELRSSVHSGIARILFTVSGSSMVLLHSFMKKSQKAPLDELNLARKRLRHVQVGDDDEE